MVWVLAMVGWRLAEAGVLPILAGVWADGRLGTKPWLMLGGFALGLAVGMVQLMQIVRERGRRGS